jgi:PPOX class probable F420-dependent enzyme
MVEIPSVVRAQLEARNFWQFVTINADGSPTATPVWAGVEDDVVLVNTAIGRRKERNVRRDPRVALAMVDRQNPYSWIEIRGRVVEFIEGERADESIDGFARKYLGLPRYATGTPGERRVLLRIEPTRIRLNTEAGSDPDALQAKLDAESADRGAGAHGEGGPDSR